MAINWNTTQKPTVEEALKAHPPNSQQCLAAARKILPVARQTDGAAMCKILQPKSGHFIVPKANIGYGNNWEKHAAVKTVDHVVDAMTGVDGVDEKSYIQTHFHFADQVDEVEVAQVPAGFFLR